MNFKRNLCMIFTAVAAFLVILCTAPNSGGSNGCVIRGMDRMPTLLIRLELPDNGQ